MRPWIVQRLYSELAYEHAGEVATYIPEFGKANPDHFGIAVAFAFVSSQCSWSGASLEHC